MGWKEARWQMGQSHWSPGTPSLGGRMEERGGLSEPRRGVEGWKPGVT